jgi:hypothetical protein
VSVVLLSRYIDNFNKYDEHDRHVILGIGRTDGNCHLAMCGHASRRHDWCVTTHLYKRLRVYQFNSSKPQMSRSSKLIYRHNNFTHLYRICSPWALVNLPHTFKQESAWVSHREGKGKRGKVFPVQAVEALRIARGWGSHMFRYSAARFSALRAGRFLLPGRSLVLISVSRPQGHNIVKDVMLMESSNLWDITRYVLLYPRTIAVRT